MNFREKKKCLKRIKREFRLLSSWRINLINRKDTSDGDGGVWTDGGENRNATMFAASNSDNEAKKVLLHECLHVCLAEIDNQCGIRKKAAQELFVHDMERLMFVGYETPMSQMETDEWIDEFAEMYVEE